MTALSHWDEDEFKRRYEKYVLAPVDPWDPHVVWSRRAWDAGVQKGMFIWENGDVRVYR